MTVIPPPVSSVRTAQLTQSKPANLRDIHFAGDGNQVQQPADKGKSPDNLDKKIQDAYSKAKRAFLFKGRAYRKAAELAYKLLESKREPEKSTGTVILLILNDMASYQYYPETAKKVTNLLLDIEDPKTAAHARHTAFRLKMDITGKVVDRAQRLVTKFQEGKATAQDKVDAALTSEYMMDHHINPHLAVELGKYR